MNVKCATNISVKSITITSEANSLAGEFSVDPSTMAVTGGGSNTLTLNVAEPYAAVTSAGVPFYVVVPAGAYAENDLKLKVITSEDKMYLGEVPAATLTASNATAKDVTVEMDYGKCKESDYTQVTIGVQTWMVENYKCRRYDTNAVSSELSEAFKSAYKDECGNIAVPMASTVIENYNPFYADATKAVKPDYMTEEQMSKLGFFYNWAAAVGVADGQTQTAAFSGYRQGICPNGWHVPTTTEWDALKNYIEVTQSKGTDTAGKHLKSKEGWYSSGNGLDTYAFMALPAGYSKGSALDYVGNGAVFWTATPIESSSTDAYGRDLNYSLDYLYPWDVKKYDGRSVRCLKSIDETISVSPTTASFTPSGGSASIAVTSNAVWTASSNKSWAKLSSTSGSGNGTIKVTVDKYTTVTSDETATVTFKAANGTTATVTVTRKAGTISVSPTTKSFTLSGGSASVTVASNTSWTVSSNQSWVTLSATSGSGNGTVTINCAKNTTTSAGTATVTFTAANGKTATVTVTREAGTISVNPTTKSVVAQDGGTVSITVTSNTAWTASSNQSWAKLSATSGSGNATIKVTVSKNATATASDAATITFKATINSKTATTKITRNPMTVKDACGNTYGWVLIGDQYWTAKNMACATYSKNSDAYKEGRRTISTTSTSETYTPYYAKSTFTNGGYLYNWAAAVGVADGKKQTSDFSGNRQGICPDGWHVPTKAEYQTLVDYIEVIQGKGTETAGKHLKSTSGWTTTNGLDTYGFTALPAGWTSGIEIFGNTTTAEFWTATPGGGTGDYYSCFAYKAEPSSWYGSMTWCTMVKWYGYSVRCVRN